MRSKINQFMLAGIASACLVSAVQALETVNLEGTTSAQLLKLDPASNQYQVFSITDSQASGNQLLAPASNTQWQLISNGDFNADGSDDLLWLHKSDGSLWSQLMNGTQVSTEAGITTMPAQWQLQGVADFNGDGTDDILWRHQESGLIWMHFIENGHIKNSYQVGEVTDLDWQIIAVDDFNADGKADIYWHNTSTKANWLYLMDGNDVLSSHAMGKLEGNWQLIATGNFDNQGSNDLLWRNLDTGLNWLQRLNSSGTVFTSQQLNTIDNQNWLLATFGDYDGDGDNDLIWSNSQTGAYALQVVQGGNIAGESAVLSFTFTDPVTPKPEPEPGPEPDYQSSVTAVEVTDGDELKLIADHQWQSLVTLNGDGFVLQIDGDEYGDDGSGQLVKDGAAIGAGQSGDFKLLLNDDDLSFTLTAQEFNEPPIAKITVATGTQVAPDGHIIVSKGDSITLLGTDSSDPDGIISEYIWSTGKTTEQTSIQFNFPTTTKIYLTVTDDQGKKSEQAEIVVEILPPDPNLTDGTVRGFIADAASDDALSNATISIKDNNGNNQGTIATESNGSYSKELPPGDYRFEISATGYLPAVANVTILGAEIVSFETIKLVPSSVSGDGTIRGIFKNATNGKPVSAMELFIVAGINSKGGTVLATTTTSSDDPATENIDESGLYEFQIDSGNYTVYNANSSQIDNETVEWLTGYLTVVSVGGETIDNQNTTISPKLAPGETRIVVTWGKDPSDLDTYLWTPSGYRISYPADRRGSQDEAPFANLDVDDTDSYGPETATIRKAQSGTYYYSIQNYTAYSDPGDDPVQDPGSPNNSNATSISQSNVRVDVYTEDGLLRSYFPDREQNANTQFWNVFSYNAETQELTTINEMSAVPPAGAGTVTGGGGGTTPIDPAPNLANVEFSCNNGQTESGESIYVVGNLPELGMVGTTWTVASAAQKLEVTTYPDWKKQIVALPINSNIEWKCVKAKESDLSIIQWQAGDANNTVTTGGAGSTKTAQGNM